MCRANPMKYNNTPGTTIKGIVDLHFATEHDWPWYSRGGKKIFSASSLFRTQCSLIKYSQRQGQKWSVSVRNEEGGEKKCECDGFLVFHRSLISSKSMLRLLNVRTCCNSTAESRGGGASEKKHCKLDASKMNSIGGSRG